MFRQILFYLNSSLCTFFLSFSYLSITSYLSPFYILFLKFHYVKRAIKWLKILDFYQKYIVYNRVVVWKFINKSFTRVDQGAKSPKTRHFLMFHYVKRDIKSSKIQYSYQKCIALLCAKFKGFWKRGLGPLVLYI